MKTTTLIKWGALALALLLAAGHVQAGWIGATSGTTDDDAHDYTNTNNWENGIIDDVLTNTLTGATTLYFKKDHATGPNGLNVSVSSDSTTVRNFTLAASGGPYTLTLNGDLMNGGTKAALFMSVPVNLGGAARTIHTGSLSIQWSCFTTNGTIIKTGGDQLRLNSSSLYLNAPVIVNQGTLYPYLTAVNYTVPTIVNNAGLLFYSSCYLRNTPSITLNAVTANSTLTSQDLRNGENRLGDNADIILATAGNGNIGVTFTHQIDQTTGVDAEERIGRLVLRSGQSKLIQGSRYSGSAVFIALAAGSLVRESKSTLTVLNTKTTGDSESAGNAQLGMRREVGGLTACGNQFFLDTPPAMLGGPVSRGTDAPVIPYIMGVNVVSNNTGQTLNTLMTYDAAGGMRAMRTRTDLLGNPAEFVEALSAAHVDGKDNVRVTANATVAGAHAANALLLAGGTLTLAADARVTLGSGLLAFAGGTLAASDSSVIDVGTNEGVLFNSGGKTVAACLAGSGGYTLSAFNGTVKLTGTNTYSGTTAIVSGTLNIYRLSGTPHNVALPDDGLVLIHPGATLEVGYYQSDYATRETIGALAGGGRVQLGWISGGAYPRSLVIGAGGSGEPGEITLDGGRIGPGLPGEAGTLSVINESNGTGAPIPVRLKNGTLDIDIAGPGVCDLLSTLTNVNINAGGNLKIDVKVQGFTPTSGDQWTIISSSAGPITDGNGGKLFDTITDNSDRFDFTAAIAVDAKSVVLRAVASEQKAGAVIVIR